MRFKNFLTEIEAEDANDIIDGLSIIKKELAQMDPEELEDFIDWLLDEMADEDDDVYDNDDIYTLDNVMGLINQLSSEDLRYVVYMLGEVDEEDLDYDEVDESISVRFTSKQKNRKKNKRFSLSKAQFRAGKAARAKKNRQNKSVRKKNYRKNKVKLKKYNKSYNKALKTGHNKKIRR
jgi:hypothetical protein